MNLKEQKEEFDNIMAMAWDVMFSKGNDYANDDRLSNFKLSGNIVGITPEQNCLSLIATKVARLGVLLKGKEPSNESVKDSIKDLIGYSILLQMLESEKKENKFTNEEKF